MQLRRVLSFLALALLAFPAAAFGQGAGIIRGRVSDAATGAPLVGVAVRVDGTAVGALTDADGAYTITGAPAGARVLTTRRLGYAPQRVAVAVPGYPPYRHILTALGCEPSHHHHVVCSRCGRATDIADAGLTTVVDDIEARTGYRIDRHRLELFGVCPACKAEEA